VLEFANEFFWQQTTGYLSRTAPFLILALVVAFFARSVRLFRSADQINQVLAGRLAQREAELSEAHARERDLVRFQAHADERQRILRDMHDGLGSQLMSMLLAARRGEVKPDRLAEGLQSVIDEMRLIIASMDSVGESLFAALSLFRDRMTPRIDAAGFTLEWDDRYRSDFPEYGPRPTLQVFRILQEAVTNALKHSGGDRVHVLIEPSPAAGVRITVSDNGLAARGAQAVLTGTGRGLANMQTRAAAIGARISVTHSSEGVAVTLDLPPGDTSPGPRRIAA
jgi:signal transduction histidine kinase